LQLFWQHTIDNSPAPIEFLWAKVDLKRKKLIQNIILSKTYQNIIMNIEKNIL
jgi:hypothetical protein